MVVKCITIYVVAKVKSWSGSPSCLSVSHYWSFRIDAVLCDVKEAHRKLLLHPRLVLPDALGFHCVEFCRVWCFCPHCCRNQAAQSQSFSKLHISWPFQCFLQLPNPFYCSPIKWDFFSMSICWFKRPYGSVRAHNCLISVEKARYALTFSVFGPWLRGKTTGLYKPSCLSSYQVFHTEPLLAESTNHTLTFPVLLRFIWEDVIVYICSLTERNTHRKPSILL